MKAPLASFLKSPYQKEVTETKAVKKEKKGEKDKNRNPEEIFEMLRGEDGVDGVSVISGEINTEGNLILTLSDETIFNAGKVRGEDGLPGDPGKDAKVTEKHIEEVVGRVLAALPETQEPDILAIAEAVRASLPIAKVTGKEIAEALKEEEITLEIKAIKGLKELISKLREELANDTDNKVRNIRFAGGSTNIRIKNNSTPVGQVETINFIGATITSVGDGREINVTIPSSGGVIPEVPTGTVNGSNTTFTVTNTPLWISVDGTNKFSPTNYTYATGTITIVDGAPPTLEIHSFHA